MANQTPEQGLINVHEFFDGLKKRSLDWIKEGNELHHCEDGNGHGSGQYPTVTIKFYKKPPPKQYTFTEAYAMMKVGRWMKPLHEKLYPAMKFRAEYHDNCLHRKTPSWCGVSEKIESFPVDCFGCQWEEVQP